jgi:hypothetical protein
MSVAPKGLNKPIQESNMKCRVIRTDDELKQYVDRFAEYSGIVYPFQYLRPAKVFGMFDSEKLVGGFILADGDNIRWMKQIPLENNEFFKSVDPSMLVELNGVWLDASLRKSNKTIDFWSYVAKEIVAFGKPIPTFAYITERKGLAELYQPITVGKIFAGQMTTSDKHLTVCYSNLFRFRYFKVLYAGRYVTRYFRDGGKSEQHLQKAARS